MWLKDLTRLKVPIPYLRHMFEDALKEKETRKMNKRGMVASYSSSFDQEAEGSAVRHKESTGR